MAVSLIRRSVYVLLLLWVVSIVTFWLSKQIPGDAILDYISIDDQSYSTSLNYEEQRRAYERVSRQRGLDLPEFYFSMHPGFIPDTVYSILPMEDRKSVIEWSRATHDGETSLGVYTTLRKGLAASCYSENALCNFYHQSLSSGDIRFIKKNANSLYQELSSDSPDLAAEKTVLQALVYQLDILENQKKKAGWLSLPVFRWNGFENQYHHWISGLVSLRPMTSLVDGRNAWSKIIDALRWTLLLNGAAFILSILLGIYIGIWSGINDGKRIEKWVNGLLFALFALPSFWLGTLFIYFLSSGEWVSLFPTGGLGPYRFADNVFEKTGILVSHLILPVMCLMLGALAYISRQMKQSMLHEYKQPYVLMLRAQGIAEHDIVRRHIIRNALFPIVTLMGTAIPALLSGSLVIEVLFSIPGMGRLMYNSLLARDWPVAFPVLMLVAFITILSYILTDVVYRWLDPRVKVLQS